MSTSANMFLKTPPISLASPAEKNHDGPDAEFSCLKQMLLSFEGRKITPQNLNDIQSDGDVHMGTLHTTYEVYKNHSLQFSELELSPVLQPAVRSNEMLLNREQIEKTARIYAKTLLDGISSTHTFEILEDINFEPILNDKECADCILIISFQGVQRELCIHSAIVMQYSLVFQQFFSERWTPLPIDQASNLQKLEIALEDILPDVCLLFETPEEYLQSFQEFITAIYSNNIHQFFSDDKKIFVLSQYANYFDYRAFKTACRNSLIQDLSISPYLPLNELLDLLYFVKTCQLEEVVTHILHTSFLQLDTDILHELIESFSDNVSFRDTYGIFIQELLDQVTSQLDLHQLTQLLQHTPNLTKLELDSIGSLEQKDLEELISCLPSTLQHLVLPQEELTNELLQKIITRCPHLISLDLTGTKVTLENVFFNSCLKKLILSKNSRITNESLKNALQHASEIEELFLRNTELSIEGLSPLKKLRILDLSYSHSVTNTTLQKFIEHSHDLEEIWLDNLQLSLENITFGKKLTTFSITGNTAISDWEFEKILQNSPHLATLFIGDSSLLLINIQLPAGLKRLHLNGNDNIQDNDFKEAVAHCPLLEEVVIDDTLFSLEGVRFGQNFKALNICGNEGVTNETLQHAISSSPSFEKLSISETEVSLENITFSAPFTSIDITTNIHVTDENFFKSVRNCMGNLTKVHLETTRLTLSKMKFGDNLRYLYVDFEGVTDDTFLPAIQDAHYLEEVFLEGTSVSLQGAHFSEPLVSLHLLGCENITETTLNEAISECTNLQELDIGYTNVIVSKALLPCSIKKLYINGLKSLTNTSLSLLLKKLPNLVSLDISDTDVSLEGVAFNKRLQHLNITDCNNISAITLNRMRTEYPEMVVSQ